MNAIAVAEQTQPAQQLKMIKQAGVEYYYQNSLLHRTNGPAVYKPGGLKAWYVQGVRHFTPNTYQEMAGLTDKEMADLIVLFRGF